MYLNIWLSRLFSSGWWRARLKPAAAATDDDDAAGAVLWRERSVADLDYYFCFFWGVWVKKQVVASPYTDILRPYELDIRIFYYYYYYFCFCF